MPGVLYDLQGNTLFRRIVTSPLAGTLGERGEIKEFSPRAGSRMRRYLRTCRAEYTIMVTLTYPFSFPTDGRTCKEHLDRFMRWARLQHTPNHAATQEFSAFWFLEFQERGAPHFHIFTNRFLPRDLVAVEWYRIVGSDDHRHLAAGTRVEWLKSGRYGTCSYASKYAAKACQKQIPPNFVSCGRFWGVYGLRECSAASIFFPEHLIDSPVFREFRAEMGKILTAAKGSARYFSFGGWTKGVFITNEKVTAQVKLLMARTGMKLATFAREFGLFESPLLDCPGEIL